MTWSNTIGRSKINGSVSEAVFLSKPLAGRFRWQILAVLPRLEVLQAFLVCLHAGKPQIAVRTLNGRDNRLDQPHHYGRKDVGRTGPSRSRGEERDPRTD